MEPTQAAHAELRLPENLNGALSSAQCAHGLQAVVDLCMHANGMLTPPLYIGDMMVDMMSPFCDFLKWASAFVLHF